MTTKQGINTALKIIGLAGFAGVAVVAPNAVVALEKILAKTNVDDQRKILAVLKLQGLVYVLKNEDEIQLTITPAGAHRLQKNTIDEIKPPVITKWDKSWRLVTFDVPINLNKNRRYFTKKLQNMGLVMIQKSMWVHPSDCFEQIEQVASHFNVMRYCTLMEVTRLDDATTKKLIRKFQHIIKP